MSVGPTAGLIGSAAGIPLSQTKGNEAERSQRDATAQQRQTDSADKADAAAGIGETAEDQQSSDRDADGRRLWEAPSEKNVPNNDVDTNDLANASHSQKQSIDASGTSGNQLDLTG